MAIQQAVAEKSQPHTSKPAVHRSKTKSLHTANVSWPSQSLVVQRKSDWFSVEIKNYDTLPKLGIFDLSSLQMFMTFHSVGDIAHFMTNTSF